MSGLVAIRQNIFGGSRQFGAQVPDIREGDQVQPGMPVADVLDLSEMELVAKVGELDRANLVEGQEALIELDALAGKIVHGKIKTMSGTATANVMAGDPSKKFDVTFSVDMKELLSTVARSPSRSARCWRRPNGTEADRFRVWACPPSPRREAHSPARAAIRRTAYRAAPRDSAPASQAADAIRTRELGPRRGTPPSSQERPAAHRADGAGKRRIAAQADSVRGARRAWRRLTLAPGFPNPGRMGGGRGGSRFTDQELAAAKLPLPPEEDSGLQVLLRPGLLADLEVIIGRFPNAISIPGPADSRRGGKGGLREGQGEVRRAFRHTLAKRSESTMVIAAGLKPGEEVALANPTKASSKKKDEGKSGGGAFPMAAPTGSKS